MIKTYRYRVKNLNGLLRKQAKTVNYVWNYCNETQKSCLRLGKRWVTEFDLVILTSGVSKELGIYSGTISEVCKQYVQSRSQRKRPFLRWRDKKSLGWIPLTGRSLRHENNGFRFNGNFYKVFLSRQVPICAKFVNGSSFAEDSKGHWYINLKIEVPDVLCRKIETAVGIDLGLKDFAVLSNGDKIKNPSNYRVFETRLAKAQRAKKKVLTKSINLKIHNRRKDFLHKESTKLVKNFDLVVVGDVSSSKLVKTHVAKSVSDAGWSSFRNMLRYKAIALGATFMEVNEKFTTQVCSSCGCIPPESPKGIAGLGIRTWCCSDCGAEHDRDVNSARNILFGSGHRTLAEGIPYANGENVKRRIVEVNVPTQTLTP